MTKRLAKKLIDKPLTLPDLGGHRASVHVFERRSILAVNTALDCGRPLLVRGEPGTGKSQLARAVAMALHRVFVSVFVDAGTEAQDLLWFHDAVTRLAEAQVQRAKGGGEVAKELARERFVVPRALWWALDWKGAERQAGEVAAIKEPPPAFVAPCDPKNGVVLLIDEIDKADSSVPNGLLECLGQRTFAVPGLGEPVRAKGIDPLVVLTTNEDRVLPDAFVRRCVVLHLRVDEDGLVDWLMKRGRAHNPDPKDLDDDLLRQAAEQVERDRKAVRRAGFCPPGLAEYIDLLAAVKQSRAAGDGVEIEEIAEFVLRKHADSQWIDSRGREG